MHKILIRICLWLEKFFQQAEAQQSIRYEGYELALRLKQALSQAPAINAWMASQLLGTTPINIKKLIKSGKIDLPAFHLGEFRLGEKAGVSWWIPTASFGSWLMNSKKAEQNGSTEAFYMAMGGMDKVSPYFDKGAPVTPQSVFTNYQIGQTLFESSSHALISLEEIAPTFGVSASRVRAKLQMFFRRLNMASPVVFVRQSEKQFLFAAQVQILKENLYIFDDNQGQVRHAWIPEKVAKEFPCVSPWVLKTFPFKTIDARGFSRSSLFREKPRKMYLKEEVANIAGVLSELLNSHCNKTYPEGANYTLFSKAASELGVSESTLLQRLINKKWAVRLKNTELNGEPVVFQKDVENIIIKYKKIFEEIGFWLIVAFFVWIEFF